MRTKKQFRRKLNRQLPRKKPLIEDLAGIVTYGESVAAVDIETGENLTVGQVARVYRALFNLGTVLGFVNSIKHDAIHVATGFSITTGDEERAAIYDGVLNRGNHRRGARKFQSGQVLDDKVASISFIVDKVRSIGKETRETIRESTKTDNPFYTPAFRKAQLETRPISKKEIEAHYKLARTLERKIRKETGKWYFRMRPKQVANLPASLLDISEQANTIKRKYMSHANRIAEERTVAASARVAKRLGQSTPFNSDCQPWR